MTQFIILYAKDFYEWYERDTKYFDTDSGEWLHRKIDQQKFEFIFKNIKSIDSPRRKLAKSRLERPLNHFFMWDKRYPNYNGKTRRNIKLRKIMRKNISHNPHLKITLDDFVFESFNIETIKYNVIYALLEIREDIPRNNY